MPLVSAVVPTHNRAHVLRRALCSVLQQSDVDLELIVVDDASTDDTLAVLSGVEDSRLRVVMHEVNRGGGASRNTGLRWAEGRYVAFLDSDDEWLPGTLVKAIATIRAAGAALLISSFLGRRRGRLVKVTPGACIDASFRSLLRLQAGPFTTSCFVLDRDRAPHATFSEVLPALQDLDFALALAADGHRVAGSRMIQTVKTQSERRVFSPQNAVAARLLLLDQLDDHLRDDPVAQVSHHRAILAALASHEGSEAARDWLDGPGRDALRGDGHWLRAAYALGGKVGDAGVRVAYAMRTRPLSWRLRDRLDVTVGAR